MHPRHQTIIKFLKQLGHTCACNSLTVMNIKELATRFDSTLHKLDMQSLRDACDVLVYRGILQHVCNDVTEETSYFMIQSDKSHDDDDDDYTTEDNVTDDNNEDDYETDEEETKEYNVERILMRNRGRHQDYYLVLWEDGDKTWEPRSVLMDDIPELVLGFDRHARYIQ